ncbi:Poly(A) RNA polymerase protein 2, partial [Diplonema papillatum]
MSLYDALGEELSAAATSLELTPPEQLSRQELIKKTKRLVRQVFPSCTVEIYGSWATHLALPSSDIDFVVLGVKEGREKMLDKVARAFKKGGLLTTAVVSTARVPVVKFTCPQTKLRGDITFDIPHWSDSVSLVRDNIAAHESYHA